MKHPNNLRNSNRESHGKEESKMIKYNRYLLLQEGGCNLPRGRGAERDRVICPSASESACGIIIRIAIRPGTGCFEHLRVDSGAASGRGAVCAAAAVLWAPERTAGTLARATPFSLQLGGALLIQVCQAPSCCARARATARFNYHRQVVPTKESISASSILQRTTLSESQ